MPADLYSLNLYLNPERFNRRRETLQLLRGFILPPSAILQLPTGYLACWQLWPPAPEEKVLALSPSVPIGMRLFDGRRHEVILLAEYPWLSYTFEDAKKALKAPAHVVDLVMRLGGSASGDAALRVAFFTNLSSTLRHEVGLSWPAITRIWEYMPCGKPIASPDYPECHLNIRPSPAEAVLHFLTDVVAAIGGRVSFHFRLEGSRVLWLHIPSARVWWEEKTGLELTKGELWEGLLTFPHLIIGRRPLRFDGKRRLCNGFDLTEWYHIRHGHENKEPS